MEVETFLSENKQAWQDLTFDEFSEYFRKHLKQHFPFACVGKENSFRAVVKFVFAPNHEEIHIQCTDPSLEAIINEINDIHNIEISFVRQTLVSRIFDVKGKHSAIPHFFNFLGLARAQWDRVKSEQKYNEHRRIKKGYNSDLLYTDGDEVGDLQEEITRLYGRRLSPFEQFELHKKMQKKKELETGYDSRGYRLPPRVYVERFVYYLFFGKYRKSNRWV